MATAVCEKCGGTGYVVVERQGLSGAERCSCFYETRVERLQETSNIPPNFSNRTLESFQLPVDNPIARTALSEVFLSVKRFAGDFDPRAEKPGLLLVGNPGTGKTHLAVGALKMLIAKGFEGLFYDYQQLLTDIQRGWTERNSSTEDPFRRVMEVDVLLLDDLGARRSIDWVEDVVTEIITYRYNNRKPLIATTNLAEPAASHQMSAGKTPGGMNRAGKSLSEVIGERSRSRLFEMCRVVTMPAVEDYRLRRR